MEPTRAQMFSAFEQFWHRIKDLSDLDAILFPFRRETLTKMLPRCSRVGPAAREAPKRNFRANLGSNFSVFEQSWHKIKDLADLDAILVPILSENLTKTLPRWSQVGPRHRARAAQEDYSGQFGLKWRSNSEQLCTMNLPRI